MKIINPGTDTTNYRFHCKCGCVYEVAEWELQYSSELAFPRYRYTRCPRCNELIPVDYAEIVNSTDTLTETISETESKSESAENGCEGCAYLGSSNFCVIPGKTPSDETCDQYKSIATNIIERSEFTKLRVSVKFLQNYCVNHHNCKGCPYDKGEGCELTQEPRFWNTDF